MNFGNKNPMVVKIEPHPDYLGAIVTGAFDPEQLDSALKEIFAVSVRHGLRKILIDIRQLEGNITVLARHDAGRIVAREASLQGRLYRLVVVGTEEQMWPDRFFENVANNRGIVTKVTLDMAEALAWLRESA
jgi:hypothetical protein